MNFSKTKLEGCYTIELSPFIDERGWFARTYCATEFEEIGFRGSWVQLNHSFTTQKGTIRGMHFQLQPYSEVKLVRCIAGSVYDVIIDLRKDSPTFLSWIGIELSATNKKMIFIPEGFAHGFQTLSDNCELIYHHSVKYQPNVESGILYNDPMINIAWPIQVTCISERDKQHKLIDLNFTGL